MVERTYKKEKYARASRLEKLTGIPVPDYMTVRAVNVIMNALGEDWNGVMRGDIKENLERAMNMTTQYWLYIPNCGRKTAKLINQYLHGETNE
jgi:hypothetical protein